MNCRLLFNEEPITINRLAAKVLGLNEAIVVQQIHYWLNINSKAKKNIYDGRVWTYNTYETWQNENFDFWSLATVKRIFKKLFDSGILLKSNYNKYKYDKTTWVSIDYNKLEDILIEYESIENTKTIENVEISTKCQNDTMSNSNKVSNCYYGECQNDTMDNIKMTPTITETTKDYTEISISTTHQDAVVEKVPSTNKELIESNTHLIIDSLNKESKVKKWKQDRLLKAIDIFKKQEGVYFSLLEKIYKDDKNFAIYSTASNLKESETLFNSKVHNFEGSCDFMKYDEEELERILLENNKNKLK